MNILINTKTLRNALHDIIGVVSKDLSMPILSHVLVEKSEKQIKITGTNLEMQITVKATFLESDEFDPITVSGRKLYEIVRSLDDQNLQITTSKNRLILKTKNSSFKLSTLPANNFPTFEEVKFLETFTINEAQLLDLLNKTSFSMASNTDVRFILCGLLLEITPNNLTAVATDAHRLAISSKQLDKKQINNISCIVPRKSVLELIRILQGGRETKVSVGNNQIRVDFKDLNFISKLMDGKFPAGYKAVIPTTATIEILLEKQNIRSALQRVSILANEKFKGVRIEATNEIIVLSSENPEQEEAKETIKHQSGSTEQNKVLAGFNAGYLIEAINACSGEEIVMGLNGPKESPEKNASIKTKTEGTLIFSPSDSNTKYVVMPYNL
jgi:DNA polymerase-3 subunit beta